MAAAAGPASDALEAVTSMCQQTQDAVLESNAQMRALIELLAAINTTLGGERGGGGDNSVRIGDDDAGTDNGEGDDGEGGVDGKSPSDDGGATSTPAVRARASDSVYEASCRDAPRHVTPAVYDCICGVCEVCYAKAASDADGQQRSGVGVRRCDM